MKKIKPIAILVLQLLFTVAAGIVLLNSIFTNTEPSNSDVILILVASQWYFHDLKGKEESDS